MSDANWALAENGADIAEVSYEAGHADSTASNLLDLHEDRLWITGDAPQHVTLSLSPSHPPLEYAGWHVWHNYSTNPHRVEIASGASLATMETLLLCEARVGAGTQIWKLPRAIPRHHRYVRFKIMGTFQPGPTYMNNIVLLENDPGADSKVDCQPVDDALDREAVAKHQRCAAASPYLSSPSSALRPTGVTDNVNTSPLPRHTQPMSTLSSTPISLAMTPCGGQRAGEARSSSRMSQLLRGLDDDIKMLKPIKTPSPAKRAIFRLPQGRPFVLADNVSEDEAFSLQHGCDSDNDGDANDEGVCNGKSEPIAHHHRRHHCRSSSQRRNRGGQERHGCNGLPTHLEGSRRPAPAPTSAPHLGWAVAPQPPVISSVAELGSLNEARLCALEQAVASLNEAVQHQRDDLMMIKRVLLQQATERRKEAEQRYEERQRLSAVALSLQRAVTATPPVGAAAAAPAPVSQFVAPDQRLTHRSITVGFPEDALRTYVESLLDRKLHKYMKKMEARGMRRMDNQLHDVIQVLSATIEGRLAGVVPPHAEAQRRAASAHTGHSTHGVRDTASN
ncbi:hypothetical protein JKF63_03331 [Porcisia hertigi]|uniref:Uncharacterized protein n=1 Tax=Porcisia hertigi TaxID=2761500 RepID=A0A836L982_9TRYP|nr:hypothetical protein JKF63_03331 [Porcisia hertigi]